MTLAILSLGWYIRANGFSWSFVLALLAAYAMYALGALLETKFDTPVRAALGTTADAAFLALWAWLDPTSWPPALACALLLTSAVMLHDLTRTAATCAVALLLAVAMPPGGQNMLLWTVLGVSGVSVAMSVYRNYLQERMSNTLRHNVIIRAQAEGAREAERQRIAADFHDGPLQSFIGFQMRLELIRKLMAKDVNTAAEELRNLQELCRSQVADLRSFVRSMRPTDEGMSLAASLNRMADSFQRDTGISTTLAAGEIADPGEVEVSLELLQIVREALNNIQKHSSATRIVLSLARKEQRLEISIEDNGTGFPFCGSFNLEELELLRMGPVSIKRRVRLLNGDMILESNPSHGSRLELRVPV